jgi:hypothetical protein
MKDFLVFRRMATPILIQVLYWIATVIVIVVGLVMIIGGPFISTDPPTVIYLGLLILLLGPLVVRIYAELSLVLFRMNETLTEIKDSFKQN